jgi:hypothetical protein
MVTGAVTKIRVRLDYWRVGRHQLAGIVVV